MAINLAEDAVHALNRAAAAAAREHCEAIAPVHVLAGAVSQGAPALVAALDELGLCAEALPDSMRDVPEVYGGHLPFTSPAHAVLAEAIDRANAAGGPGSETTSVHLLMGVARAGDDQTGAVLAAWGLGAASLEKAVARAAANADGDNESAKADDPAPAPSSAPPAAKGPR